MEDERRDACTAAATVAVGLLALVAGSTLLVATRWGA